MSKYKLTMFQNFNAMRMYMTAYFDKTKDEDIGLLLSGLMLSTTHSNWKENLLTWDAAAWQDWMDGVKKTLHDMNIQNSNPMKIQYTEEMAFLCMKNYLNLFYKQVAFEGVKNILKIINSIHINSTNDENWNYWLSCMQAAIDQEAHIIG